ncbi:MAG: hypothetical protein SVO26_04085 [Chloroflexota bacterium]|nr:hypothetical protein [Chloroflexota bacterium]
MPFYDISQRLKQPVLPLKIPEGFASGRELPTIAGQKLFGFISGIVKTRSVEYAGYCFPDLINAVRTVRSYVSEGREFYEVTYSGSAAVVVEGGKTIQIPRIVVVIIDEDTGEKFVAESD